MNTALRLVSWITVALLAVTVSARGGNTPQNEDAAALSRFSQAVQDYRALQLEALDCVPPLRSSASPAEILQRLDALSDEIRARRPHAQTGDIFTAAVKPAFRRLIARSILAHGDTPEDVVSRNRSELLPGAPPLVVNQRFPWQLGASMPICLIEDLPALPSGLQYRLVERDLILLDREASLVVDILPDAIARPAAR
jgi:hypothetical protein